jgi:hypothetical protein
MSATSATSMMYLESRTEWPPFGTSWIDTWAALAAATAQRIKEVVKAFIVTSAGVGGRGKELLPGTHDHALSYIFVRAREHA